MLFVTVYPGNRNHHTYKRGSIPWWEREGKIPRGRTTRFGQVNECASLQRYTLALLDGLNEGVTSLVVLNEDILLAGLN